MSKSHNKKGLMGFFMLVETVLGFLSLTLTSLLQLPSVDRVNV